jgi:hypothetical protein
MKNTIGLELAIIAKEKGFNPYNKEVKYATIDNRNGEHSLHSFYRNGKLNLNVSTCSSDFFGVIESYENKDDKIHSAPTLSELQDWLIENYNIQTYAYSHTPKKKYGEEKRWGDYVGVWETTQINDARDEEFQTRQECLENVLIYAFKKLQ